MAKVVPDVLPERVTAGEKNVVEVLRGLPDGVVVYYEAPVRNRHPDVIVIDPAVGLIVLEVKSWKIGTLDAASPEACRLKLSEGIVNKIHPLQQARNYAFRLVDEMKLHPLTRHLHSGPSQRFPFLWLAVLTSISRQQLRDKFGPEADRVFPPDRVLTRDDLAEMRLLPPLGLRDSFRCRFDPWWEFKPLEERQMNGIRAWLHPEIVLSKDAPTPSHRLQGNLEDSLDYSPLSSLKVLNLEQESHACRIGDGHRILSGVAGSGKTCILVARAKLLRDHFPKIRILFLCFNKLLAEHLRSVMGKHRKIEVRHFHGWARDLGHPWNPDIDEETWAKEICKEVGSLSIDKKYDLVLVDEAQDFQPRWLLASRLALSDPEDGDLLLAGDGCQNLYRKKFTWSSVGIKASGRILREKYNLHRNYRNSREIATLARDVMTGALKGHEGKDAALPALVGDPSISPRQTRLKPVLWKCLTREAECEGALGLVMMLLKGGWPESEPFSPLRPEEIAILYPQKAHLDLIERLKNTLESQGIPNSWLSQPFNPKSYRVPDTNRSGVKIQTIHSSKGLQYRAVVLIWADALSSSMHLDEESEAQLMYVACTRAEDFLGILHSKQTSLLSSLKRSGSATVLES